MIKIILIGLLGLVLTNCAQKTYEVKQEAKVEDNRVLNQVPQWYIDAMIEDGIIMNRDADNYIYSVGQGTSPDLQLAVEKAVMIAKALVHEPKLLILDEPTAGVDIELRREMWDFLSDINKKGTTIILTTHYLEEAEQHCNNIAIIDEGSIVEDTSMKELLSRLSIQSFVLDLEQEIQELPNLSIFDLKSQDSKTLIATLTKDDDLNTLFDKLSEHGIKVKSMRNEQNRLEELFIRLVKEKDGT